MGDKYTLLDVKSDLISIQNYIYIYIYIYAFGQPLLQWIRNKDYKYSECVFVVLDIQDGQRMRHVTYM